MHRGALTKALGLTLLWMALALATAPLFGVWPLLLCPLGDALTRFWFVQRTLTRRGAEGVIDLGGVVWIAVGVVGMAVAGAATVASMPAGPVSALYISAAATLAFLLVVTAVRPIRQTELQLLTAAVPGAGTPAWPKSQS